MLDFKSSLPQAIQRSLIVAHFNLLVKKLINRFCYKPLNLSQLEKWQLQLNISHRWPTYKNSPLYTIKGHDQSNRSCKSDHQSSRASLQSCKSNYHRSRLAFHIQILVFIVLLLKNQTETIYNLLSSNKWLDREAK